MPKSTFMVELSLNSGQSIALSRLLDWYLRSHKDARLEEINQKLIAELDNVRQSQEIGVRDPSNLLIVKTELSESERADHQIIKCQTPKLSYLDYHADAERRLRKGEQQSLCATCMRWQWSDDQCPMYRHDAVLQAEAEEEMRKR